MKSSAYHFSKQAEEAITPFLSELVRGHGFVPKHAQQIDSRLSPVSEPWPWDIAISFTLLFDLKLAIRARRFGQVAPDTVRDIRGSLKKGVLVVVYVPPKLYLLTPDDLPFLTDGLSVDYLETRPSILVDAETEIAVCRLYEQMLS